MKLTDIGFFKVWFSKDDLVFLVFLSDIRMIDKYQSTSDTNVLPLLYLHKSTIALFECNGIYHGSSKVTKDVLKNYYKKKSPAGRGTIFYCEPEVYCN